VPQDDQARTLHVADAAALAALCRRLAGVPWLALDTEFVRDETYYAQLCLVQLATPELTAVVDVLALGDLQPLHELLADPHLLKVLHAGRQDLEIFYQLAGRVPAPVFDTQLAAPLLGHPDQSGYADLVQRVLGVRLDKAHTRADWRHRPLEPAQLRYAEDDVRYLAQLYPRLRADLCARGRLQWLDEELADLCAADRYRVDPERAWERIKGARNLRGGRELGALGALAAWRERTAMAENRPRGWILRDEVLLDLARRRPRDAGAIAGMRGVSDRAARRYAGGVLEALAEAARRPQPVPLPPPAPQRSDPDREALVDLLMALLRTRAAAHDLHPAVLAGRGQLQALVEDPGAAHPLLSGWRYEVVGRDLQAVVGGSAALCYARGGLRVQGIDGG